MSSINDALKRARQMKGSSNVIMPPPPRELFIQKKRSKAPRILGGLIMISLTVALVWYVLGLKENSTEPVASKTPVQLLPAKVAEVAPGVEKTRRPESGAARSTAVSARPEKAAAKPVPAAAAPPAAPKAVPVTPVTPAEAKPMASAPTPVKALEAPAAQKVPAEVKTRPEPAVVKEMKPVAEAPEAAAPKPKPVASEPVRTTKFSMLARRKPKEETKPAAKPQPETPVAAVNKTKAAGATSVASAAPPKKQPEQAHTGSAAPLEPRLKNLISDYRQAIKLDPENALAHLELGNIFFFELNDLNQAQHMYRKVLEIDPDHKLGHNNLGVTFLKQNSFNRAEAEFNAALKIDPSYADAQYNKACLSAKKGEKSKAMARLLRAAQLDPAAPRWAAGDDDLRALKDMPEFERFIRQPETENQKDE